MIPTKEQCNHWNKGCDIGQEIESWKKFVREVDKEWLDGKMPLVERADCLRYADAALLALRVEYVVHVGESYDGLEYLPK